MANTGRGTDPEEGVGRRGVGVNRLRETLTPRGRDRLEGLAIPSRVLLVLVCAAKGVTENRSKFAFKVCAGLSHAG